MGHLQKSEIIPLRHLQEFRLQTVDGFEVTQKLDFNDMFKEGDLVDVSGTAIGKGFQGGIKRHNFKSGQMTRGSKSHRQLGSIGAGTTPGRVCKGKKMPGRMGGTKMKIRKLKIIKIDDELNILMIKGALPALNFDIAFPLFCHGVVISEAGALSVSTDFETRSFTQQYEDRWGFLLEGQSQNLFW
ncbi:hypothetical protein RND71_035401 [Anisodus tanguticus]|uniref:Large ribosomal subunit protein uL3c n=1 Tax=Anisodus tanguticus TaxID=243964 RepID=A0AAE1R4V0_9SOLA|nr:hypothetical protein RND71_035401 [Anisodus tanguticus]